MSKPPDELPEEDELDEDEGRDDELERLVPDELDEELLLLEDWRLVVGCGRSGAGMRAISAGLKGGKGAP